MASLPSKILLLAVPVELIVSCLSSTQWDLVSSGIRPYDLYTLFGVLL